MLNRKKNIDRKIKVISELTKYGLNDHVGVSIYMMPNEFGSMVPHMKAEWYETTATPDGYDKMPTSKCQEMDTYNFNAELFANGITQRAEWIKADHCDCVEYLNDNPFGHPALYRVWAESRVTA